MAEAVERLFRRESRAHAVGDPVDRTEAGEHRHRGHVGAPVQGALQRADRGDDRRVHVGVRAGHDPRGEGRRVHLVLGVEDHRDLERARLLGGRGLAAEHREEVLGVAQRRVGRDGRLAAAATLVTRHDRRQLRGQRDGLPPLVRGVDRGLGRVGEREGRHGRAQRLHRRGVHRVAVDDRRHGPGQLACSGELGVERTQLVARRQVALEQQERDLLVGRVLRELGDVEAAVHEHALVGVDRADARLGDGDTGERNGLLGGRHRPGHYPQRGAPNGR